MKKILFLLTVVLALASCEPKFEKQYSWSFPVSGDWLLTAYDKADSSYYYGPFEVRAYNTSFGTDSVWIDDYSAHNFWAMKFKVAVDMKNLTFQSAGSTNAVSGYGINVIVQNGKIIGKDSLYMEVKFEDDPTTFILSGHRETSYEDYMGEF